MTQQVGVQEHYVDVRGRRVHLLEGGDGPPLVYLHGAGGAGGWGSFQGLLAERFHVYAPSHPGFGLSDDLDDLQQVDDLALHTLDLLDLLGLDRAAIVGSSLGGWIAAELAVWRADRFSALVLVDAAGLNAPGVYQPDLFAADQAQSAHLLYADPTKAPAPDYTPDVLERRLRDRATLARVAWSPYLHNPRLPRRLYRVTVPTLVVWGQEDRLIPLEIGQRWTDLLPNARLEVIPQCGHSSHREQPAALAAAITRFLADIPVAAAVRGA